MPDAPESVWIDGILGLAYSAAVPGRHDLTEYLRADSAELAAARAAIHAVAERDAEIAALRLGVANATNDAMAEIARLRTVIRNALAAWDAETPLDVAEMRGSLGDG